MRIRALPAPDFLPALGLAADTPLIRILLLYGSLRPRSYSRLVVEEAARLLQFFGAQTRIFDPADLPFPDQVVDDNHPAIHVIDTTTDLSSIAIAPSTNRKPSP